MKPARALRTVLVLAALYLASTGQVGGCAPDRKGSRKEPDAQAMSQYGLRRYGNYGPEVALAAALCPVVEIRTDKPYVPVLVRHFQRSKRRGVA